MRSSQRSGELQLISESVAGDVRSADAMSVIAIVSRAFSALITEPM